MRRRGRRLLCPVRLSMHRLVHVGRAQERAPCQVLPVAQVCPAIVRPRRVAWRVPVAARCLREHLRADRVRQVLAVVMRAALQRPWPPQVP